MRRARLIPFVCVCLLGGTQALDGGAATSGAVPAGRTSSLGRWQVSFAITGIPGTAFQGPSLGPGYRFTTARGAIGTDGVYGYKLRAVGFYYQYANGKTVTIGLNPGYRLVGKADLAGPIKHVVFHVSVQYSDLPGCDPGADNGGVLSLFDLPGSHDYVVLTLCGRTRSYKLGEPGQARVASVNVSIRPY